ncbi:disease resistance protein TAO1-like, partial [Panicum virgatum]|uniref:disease resistance protein TAO1-like n=1 Tax=Panicum virgatum TaxID=38727 RepID=UPI0019D63615
NCASLVEVPNLPASVKELSIEECDNIKSIIFSLQEDTRLVSGEGVAQQDTSSLIPGSSSSEATASTAVLNLSSAANHCFLPCLESLEIRSCDGLSEFANLPPSIKTLDIKNCGNLQSLSGQLGAVQKISISSCSRLESLESCLGELRSLEELDLFRCQSLVSLPDGPQAYSSLRHLFIRRCDGIKFLPRSLQSRLDGLELKILDAGYKEPKTWKCAMRSLVCLK